MAKTVLKIFFLISLYSIIVEAKCQLIADAGNDTIFCAINREECTIGGTPSAKGGAPPYYYKWSCIVQTKNHVFFASTFLNDTSIANPSFKDHHDTLRFFLEVTDSKGSVSRDSVTIIFSEFVFCLGQCIQFICQGDSAQLYHCVEGGIPPYTYSWMPQESLSNATISNPWAKPNTTTIYELTIIDAAGCEAQSSCNIFVYPTSIDHYYSKNRHIKIYPNPINSQAYIFTEDLNIKNLKFEILSLNGIIIKEIAITDQLTSFSTRDLKPGVFLYRLISDGQEIDTGKIIIN